MESDSAQANTLRSQTPRRLTLRRVDSAQANIAQSQTFCKKEYLRNMLLFQQICGKPKLANTACSFAGTNFFNFKPLLALIEKINFFLCRVTISILPNVFC